MAYRGPNISKPAISSLREFRDSLSNGLAVGGSAFTLASLLNPALAPLGIAGVAASVLVKAFPVEPPALSFSFAR